MRVVARPYPDFMSGRAASYSAGTADGARPGTYQYTVSGITLFTPRGEPVYLVAEDAKRRPGSRADA